MRSKSLILALLCVVFTSCSEYSRLQKSTDPDEKFQAGKNYFQEKKYAKSTTMFESIVQYFRGTPQAEELVYMLAESYMGQKDNYSASEYYQAYLRNYPRGQYAEEVRYKVAYCYYLESPDARLDQTETDNALISFYEFADLYPESEHIEQCYRYITELEDKLAYKGFLNAKLYYDLGLFGGNNYKACVVTAENTLREYPETKYRDDLVFVILQSKAKEASMSVPEKRAERYSDVIDEYYRYINEFSEGRHKKEANKILKEARQVVKL